MEEFNKTVQFKCPKCGEVYTPSYRRFFDAINNASEKDKIRSGDFFQIYCPKCKTMCMVRDFLYRDTDKNKIVIFNNPNVLRSLFSGHNFNPRNCYCVDNHYDLNNCIFCIDHNLEWLIVKIYLTLEKEKFLKKCEQKGMSNPIFELEDLIEKDGDILIYLSLENYDYCNVFSIDMDEYKKLYDKYYQLLVSSGLLIDNCVFNEDAALAAINFESLLNSDF